MSEALLLSRGYLPARLCALSPYALAVCGIGFAPTQALMLALLLELLFPQHTRPWRMAARHLSLWATLLVLLPDPFPWWQALVWTFVLALSHPLWHRRPKVAGLVLFLLVCPALLDLGLRLQPQNSVASSAARNPWLAHPSLQDYGTQQTITLDSDALPKLSLVVPSRITPWPAQAGLASRGRAVGLVFVAALLALFLSRRHAFAWVLLGFVPAAGGAFLLAPDKALDLWIRTPEGLWQVVALPVPLGAAPSSGGEGSLVASMEAARPPFAEEPRPGAVLSWVERGALQAPTQGGDPAYWPLLRHWADAVVRLEPAAATAQLPLGASRRWKIDAQGLVQLLPLP